jgi:YEATS domain-containing protein 4
MDANTNTNELIVKRIVYGSVAFWLGKKNDNSDVSHKWGVYVRGLDNEDISFFIKEVVFTLHPSFTDHVRVVKKFPFVIYESGWGEFDINITIHLIDPEARPIEFVHFLKLYTGSSLTKKPVVNETYDEIIFFNPAPEIRENLLKIPSQPHKVNGDYYRKSSIISQNDMDVDEEVDKSNSMLIENVESEKQGLENQSVNESNIIVLKYFNFRKMINTNIIQVILVI